MTSNQPTLYVTIYEDGNEVITVDREGDPTELATETLRDHVSKWRMPEFKTVVTDEDGLILAAAATLPTKTITGEGTTT